MLERIWRRIIRRKGLTLWAIPAMGLWLVSLVYRAMFFLKRSFVRVDPDLSVPVISIGNVTVGGTGKTPMVECLASFLLRDGVRVGVVSSGYGRSSDEAILEPGYRIQKLDAGVTGDEVMLLAHLVPEAVFSVHRVKAVAARRLADSGEVDVVIVDDGFQHFRLPRDLDIVTFDAAVKERLLKPFPLGLLREPLTALGRADVVVATRSNFSRDLGGLLRRLARLSPSADIYSAQFIERELVGRDRRLPVKYLEDKSVLLFAGVGNFKPLKRQVGALCADLDAALELSDHQRYDDELLERIRCLAERHNSDVILTTGKDWVKLPDFAFGRELYYLGQSIDLDPGEEKLVRLVKDRLGIEDGRRDGTTL